MVTIGSESRSWNYIQAGFNIGLALRWSVRKYPVTALLSHILAVMDECYLKESVRSLFRFLPRLSCPEKGAEKIGYSRRVC